MIRCDAERDTRPYNCFYRCYRIAKSRTWWIVWVAVHGVVDQMRATVRKGRESDLQTLLASWRVRVIRQVCHVYVKVLKVLFVISIILLYFILLIISGSSWSWSLNHIILARSDFFNVFLVGFSDKEKADIIRNSADEINVKEVSALLL